MLKPTLSPLFPSTKPRDIWGRGRRRLEMMEVMSARDRRKEVMNLFFFPAFTGAEDCIALDRREVARSR